jgi:glycolate oxidase FAD binding subunit
MDVHAALGRACRGRPAGPGDVVAGVRPEWVAEPATVDEVGAVLRVAAGSGLAIVPRGCGGRLDWGGPPERCELVLDLRRLDQVLEHAAGDLVVRVQAGVRLARLGAVLAGAGQRLVLDGGGGTVGGALAVGTAGPLRWRYGAPRDQLLGVTVVRADGVVAVAGSRVVKNVAGYDVGKLLTGSYGTLGVIVAAILRLHPAPAATGWVTFTVPDPAAAAARAAAILDSQLAASAVELDRPAAGPVELAVLVEGSPAGVAGRVAAAAALLGGAAAELAGGRVAGAAPDWWGRWPGEPAGTLVELVFPPARLAEVLDRVAAAARAAGLAAVPVRGSAGAAVLRAGLPPAAEPAAVAALLAALRQALAPPDAAVVVRRAPGAVRAAVDLWGPVDPGALRLMRRVKAEFDPDRRLSPGRFVGGI